MPTPAEYEIATIEKYARLGSDDHDIAAILKVPRDLLTEVYATELEHARAERRAILLSQIWTSAKEGKTSILIWLGKVELGWEQRAKQGKTQPHQKPDQPFDFPTFAAEFASLHIDGKPADEATLRRLALMAIQNELDAHRKPPPIVDSCITSIPSPESS
jgi:hypothetical protein